MKTYQKGFSAVEAVAVIFVVAILCAGGWYLWQSQRKKNIPPASTNEQSNQKVTQKEYVNSQYGFSFTYPDNWAFKADLQDKGRGRPEGEVTVTSPAGTVVHFNPNLGGRGGTCTGDDSDRPDYTQDCTTMRILSIEKTGASSVTKPVYITERKITQSIAKGSNPQYFIALTTTDESLKVGTPQIGAYVPYYTVPLQDGKARGYVDAFITGKDQKDVSETSSVYGTGLEYFETQRIKEGLSILQSFRIL